MDLLYSYLRPPVARIHALILSDVSEWQAEALQLLGGLIALALAFRVISTCFGILWFVFEPQPPKVTVSMDPEESENVLNGYKKFDYDMLKGETKKVHFCRFLEKEMNTARTEAEKEAVQTILLKTKIEIRAMEKKWKRTQATLRRSARSAPKKVNGTYPSQRIQ